MALVQQQQQAQAASSRVLKKTAPAKLIMTPSWPGGSRQVGGAGEGKAMIEMRRADQASQNVRYLPARRLPCPRQSTKLALSQTGRKGQWQKQPKEDGPTQYASI